MNSRRHLSLTIKLVTLVLVLLSLTVCASAADYPSYPKTTRVLEELYESSLNAWHHYNAYERQARDENLHEIAQLFAAMAASQAVTTRHIQQLLSDLTGIQPECFTYLPAIKGTRDNLRAAIEMEMIETTVSLPEAFRTVSTEGYTPGLLVVQTAVNVHNHHRKKLKRIYFYTEHFFDALAARFQKKKPRYFICRLTGTIIVDKLPADCPIHGGPTTAYVELVESRPSVWKKGCSPANGIAQLQWTTGQNGEDL